MTIMCFCFCLFFSPQYAKFINVHSGIESFAAASHTEILMGYFMRNKTIRSSQVTYVTLVPRGNETLRRNARGTPSALSSSESYV